MNNKAKVPLCGDNRALTIFIDQFNFKIILLGAFFAMNVPYNFETNPYKNRQGKQNEIFLNNTDVFFIFCFVFINLFSQKLESLSALICSLK